MLSAIGSSGPGYLGNLPSGQEAQLDKYKVQLADWVHCPSCKTPEGKAKIRELSDKIAAIEQRLKAPRLEKPVQAQARVNAPGLGGLGGRVDVYA